MRYGPLKFLLALNSISRWDDGIYFFVFKSWIFTVCTTGATGHKNYLSIIINKDLYNALLLQSLPSTMKTTMLLFIHDRSQKNHDQQLDNALMNFGFANFCPHKNRGKWDPQHQGSNVFCLKPNNTSCALLFIKENQWGYNWLYISDHDIDSNAHPFKVEKISPWWEF